MVNVLHVRLVYQAGYTLAVGIGRPITISMKKTVFHLYHTFTNKIGIIDRKWN